MLRFVVYLIVGFLVIGGATLVSEWDVPKKAYAGAHTLEDEREDDNREEERMEYSRELEREDS